MHHEQPRFSRRKTILFAFIPTLLILILLVGAEYSLRLVSPELQNPLFRDITIDGADWVQVNRSYLTKYFPRRMGRIPELRASVFRKVKSPGSIRVLCLGESTMFGVPYQMSATPAAFLRKQLQTAYPESDIEVINAGASAVNSNVILDLGKELLPAEPDVVVLYSGHNEYYGPDGISAGWLARQFPALIPFGYSLRQLALVRWFEQLLIQAPSAPVSMMQEVSRGQLVASGSPDDRWVQTQYQRNLGELISLFQVRGIPVVVSGIVSNPTFPPFVSSRGGSIDYHDDRVFLLQRLMAHDSVGRVRQLADGWLQADSSDAMAWYWLGMTALQSGSPMKAQAFLDSAIDRDLLKFRAPSQTRASLDSAARRHGLRAWPLDSAFHAAANNGIPGRELFWEHVHPTFRGYFTMGTEFARGVLATGELQRKLGPPRRQFLSLTMDSLHVAWLDKAYADISMSRLTSAWPFSNYTTDHEVLRAAPPELRSIADNVYETGISWNEGCYRSAAYFRAHGLLREALTTYRALVEDFPPNYYAWYLAGSTLKDMGSFTEARRNLETSIRWNSAYPFSRLELGLLMVNAGEFEGAAAQLSQASTLFPADHVAERATALYGLAAVDANTGKYREAIQKLDASLVLVPSYEAAATLRIRIAAHLRGK